MRTNFFGAGGTESWPQLCLNRSGFQARFVELLRGSAGLKGRVLDIGCGGGLPAALAGLQGEFGSLDGIDPDPSVMQHPLLARRWLGCFETSPVPKATYDLAYAYNVLEHIAHPRPFFEKVSTVLKPGGVFWGLTPNACHPFAALSRSVEVVGLKGLARNAIGTNETGSMGVNDYSAYYRCNSPRAVLRATRGLPFRSADFHFYPCLQWDTYFPRFLRWGPKFYDFLLGARVASLMQIFMVRLERE